MSIKGENFKIMVGGQHHGGLCASYDDKWGFSLTYVAEAKKVKARNYD